MYKFTYKVISEKGYCFPIDMLRYDCSFPADESSSGRVTNAVSHTLGTEIGDSIDLARYAATSGWMPSIERWKRFGWAVELTEWRKIV